MDTVTITFLKNDLFKVLSSNTYNMINTIADPDIVSGNKIMEYYIDEEQYGWFLSALNRADAMVRCKIAHITDNSQMIEHLKEKISENSDTDSDDTLTYMIKLSHHLQLYMISDAIEDALVAEMSRLWCINKKTNPPLDYQEIMNRLKSISLMVESRVRRNYFIN